VAPIVELDVSSSKACKSILTDVSTLAFGGAGPVFGGGDIMIDELGSPTPTDALGAESESKWLGSPREVALAAAAAAASACAFLRARIALRVVGGFRTGLPGLLRWPSVAVGRF
jgi:hypothetical protein